MLVVLPPPAAAATSYQATPKDYRAVLERLRPGDVLTLAPGIYKRGLPLHRLNGRRDAPIVIEGAGPGETVLYGVAGRNTISIVDSSYLVVRDLTLDGRDLPIDAVKAEGHANWAHDITLENLRIRGYGSDQQNVAISTKCPAWNWVVRGNVIEEAGTGMYFGDSLGDAPFVNGLIEGNLVRDTRGYNLQIKHQVLRPDDVPGMPHKQGRTIIRHNVFSKHDNASGGALSRPNVLVGHWPLNGPGIEDRYEIYGNLFYQNPVEALFQGEGNIALYNNLFVNHYVTRFPAVAIQPHNCVPRRIAVFHNTVVTPGAGITVVGGASRFEQAVFANAVFAGLPLKGWVQSDNLTEPYRNAEQYLRRPFAALGKLDLYPLAGMMCRVAGDHINPSDFTDSEQDFNAYPRTADCVGAYGRAGENPGWRLGLKRKSACHFSSTGCLDE